MLQKNEKRTLIVLLCVLVLVWSAVILVASGNRIVVQPPLDTISVADVQVTGVMEYEYLQQMQRLPPPVLQAFISNKWQLCIGCDFQPGIIQIVGYGATGATDYQKKTIHLETPSSLFHEFGHFLLYVQPIPEWEEIYEQEAASAASVLGAYALTDHREYFAECFEFFLLTQDDKTQRLALTNVAPATTKLLTALESEHWKLPTTIISIQPIPTLFPKGKD